MKLILCFVMMLFFACNTDSDALGDGSPYYSDSWVFVANEGNYGSSNGSISMIRDDGAVITTDYLGDTVQSLEVYNDKLIVLINGGPSDSKIRIFDITTSGLALPGIEIDLEHSSPRELVVVDNKVYFTNWNSQDIKIFNLFNYVLEPAISVPGLPEDIIEKNGYLWIAMTMNSDGSPASEVIKIDLNSQSIINTYNVGLGPHDLEAIDNDIFVSRTYYDNNFIPYHGMSKISNDVLMVDYGSGVPCGGSVINLNNHVYRTLADNQSSGGIVSLNSDLTFNVSNKIGSYEQSYIYHVEVIDNEIWFAITDNEDYNWLNVLSIDGEEIDAYEVGVSPGDLAKWTNND